MFQENPRTRSRTPLRTPPLPNPGDSLRGELLKIVLVRAGVWGIAAGIACVLAGLEWMRWYWALPPAPAQASIMATVMVVVAVVVWRNTDRRAQRFHLGIDGELVVGQMLERLRRDGYEIFHDLVEDGYNIDHVLIGPPGIFVIETKMHSKPSETGGKITFDGRQILINGHQPDRDPVAQVLANAARIGEIVGGATQRVPFIRGVILYPEWWVDPSPKGAAVWVLNPKALPKFLENEPRRLSGAEIASLGATLGAYLRGRASRRGVN